MYNVICHIYWGLRRYAPTYGRLYAAIALNIGMSLIIYIPQSRYACQLPKLRFSARLNLPQSVASPASKGASIAAIIILK